MNLIVETYLKDIDNEIKARYHKLVEVIERYTNEEPRISYGMPTWGKNPNIIHLSVFKSHIGVYPGPEKIKQYQEKLKDIKYSKGAIQFSHKKILPITLFEELVANIFK
jgi:uncharacterized protein YdhG (YjbR/CyaY superfamily)